ncbi:MAG TPA: hypothetical protein VGC97_14730 [Pyrinomonadaceae bacterium]|jgi:hypothetical protein
MNYEEYNPDPKISDFTDELIGQNIGAYRVTGEIGRGGIGVGACIPTRDSASCCAARIIRLPKTTPQIKCLRRFFAAGYLIAGF